MSSACITPPPVCLLPTSLYASMTNCSCKLEPSFVWTSCHFLYHSGESSKQQQSGSAVPHPTKLSSFVCRTKKAAQNASEVNSVSTASSTHGMVFLPLHYPQVQVPGSLHHGCPSHSLLSTLPQFHNTRSWTKSSRSGNLKIVR